MWVTGSWNEWPLVLSIVSYLEGEVDKDSG